MMATISSLVFRIREPMLIDRRVSLPGLLLLAAFLPSFVFVTTDAGSLAIGILCVALLTVVVTPVSITVIAGCALWSTVLYATTFLSGAEGGGLRLAIEAVAHGLLVGAAISLGQTLARSQSDQWDRLLPRVCELANVAFILLGFAALFYRPTFLGYDFYVMNVFPFSEPSHYTLVLMPFLIFTTMTTDNVTRTILLVAYGMIAFLQPSLVLLVGVVAAAGLFLLRSLFMGVGATLRALVPIGAIALLAGGLFGPAYFGLQMTTPSPVAERQPSAPAATVPGAVSPPQVAPVERGAASSSPQTSAETAPTAPGSVTAVQPAPVETSSTAAAVARTAPVENAGALVAPSVPAAAPVPTGVPAPTSESPPTTPPETPPAPDTPAVPEPSEAPAIGFSAAEDAPTNGTLLSEADTGTVAHAETTSGSSAKPVRSPTIASAPSATPAAATSGGAETGVSATYFLERLRLSTNSTNLTVLVFIQGWDEAMRGLMASNGWGFGFQSMGILPPSTLSERIRSLTAERMYVNRNDGGSIAPKIVFEFGYAGIALTILLLVVFMFCVWKIATIRDVSKNVSKPFAICLLLSFSFEYFLRGYGYFSPGVFYALIGASAWVSFRDRQAAPLPEREASPHPFSAGGSELARSKPAALTSGLI